MSLYTHSAFIRGRGLSQLKSRLKYIKHRLYKGLKPEMTKFSIKFLGQNQRKPQCLCGLSGFGVIITPASTRRTIPVAFIYIYLLILQITMLLFVKGEDLYCLNLLFRLFIAYQLSLDIPNNKLIIERLYKSPYNEPVSLQD